MLSILRHMLKRGIVTTNYPQVAEPAPEAFRGQVLLDSSHCTGDGACARVCPSNAIIVTESDDGWVWTLDDARCVFCGLCQEACPEQAIIDLERVRAGDAHERRSCHNGNVRTWERGSDQ